MQTTRPLLLVEDDQLDAAIMRRCLKRLDIQYQLVHKTDGENALEYLRDCPGNMPCAILLDLNMPGMNDLEFLGQVKADVSLRSIPVLAVTTLSSPREIQACFSLGGRTSFLLNPGRCYHM